MLRFLATAWRRWLKIAELIGNLQLTIVLLLIYWTLFLVSALPYKILTDRLALRNPGRVHWIHRIPGTDRLAEMKKQG